MKIIINSNLEVGMYQIVCTGCGFVNYGPQEGSETDAALKAMEIENKREKCKNGCNSPMRLEINPKITPNKYCADNPYPFQ